MKRSFRLREAETISGLACLSGSKLSNSWRFGCDPDYEEGHREIERVVGESSFRAARISMCVYVYIYIYSMCVYVSTFYIRSSDVNEDSVI